jgi:hypothetical protein
MENRTSVSAINNYISLNYLKYHNKYFPNYKKLIIYNTIKKYNSELIIIIKCVIESLQFKIMLRERSFQYI